MATNSFDDFVRREQQAKHVDWEVEKREWLAYLDQLYAQVNEYLKPYVDAGQISIHFREIELNEEDIGVYSAREMIITIGSKTIKLEPIGTLLIGTKGRVDVVGPVGRAQILLLDSNIRYASQLIHVSVSINGGPLSPPPPKSPSEIKWTWKIMTRPPRREAIDINKETFLNLLMEISNG